jgi:hypothetical protein
MKSSWLSDEDLLRQKECRRFVWFLRCTLLGFMSLCLLPVALIGQDSLPSQLQRLKLGQRVRILTVEGHRMEGRLGQVKNEPPALRLRTTDSTVGVGTIDSLWIGRSHAGKGAWIGALALGVPSAIFWSSFCNAVSEGQGCDALDVVAGLTLAGAAVGAGVGALIGSSSTHWELSYSRSPLSSHQRRPRMPSIQLGLSIRLP